MIRRPAIWLLLLLALVLAAYQGSLSGSFVWDDLSLIVDQQVVHDLSRWPEYFGRLFWSDPLAGTSHSFYRPLTTLSFAVDWAVFGGRPDGFHLVNVLLHLANCALVFLLARRLTPAPPAAAFAAAFFGLFPRLTESVSWISGRTDLLAAFFGLIALLVHSDRPEHRGRRIGAAFALAAGLFCKEVAGAAFLAIAVRSWQGTRGETGRARTLLTRLGPALALTACYAAARFAAFRVDTPSATVLELRTPATRLLFAAEALGTYFLMLLDALRPSLQTGVLGLLDPVRIALGAGLAVAAAGVALRFRRALAASPLLPVLTMGLVALAMVLHLIPLPVHVVAADRFLYLPVAALGVLLAAAAGKAPTRARLPVAAAAALLLATMGVATARSSVRWNDELLLWRHGVSRFGDVNALVHANLADQLYEVGRPEEALQEYRTALVLNQRRDRLTAGLYARPAEALRYRYEGSIGLCLADLGRLDEAIAQLSGLVAADPEHARFRFNLATIQARSLDFAAARRTLNELPAKWQTDRITLDLRAFFDEMEKRAAGLPWPQSMAPSDIAARARFFDELGARFQASKEWRRLADTPSAPPELLRQAAGYLALKGPRADAEAALSRLSMDEDTAGLRTVLAERWRDEAVPSS